MANKREAKEWAKANMKGLFTSPTIPFTPDFKLDEAGIRHNVEHMLKVKASGLGFGFTEPWVCSMAERKRGMEVAVDAVRKRVPAYLHSTDHSVAETIGLMRHAKSVGADAVMVWAPYEWAKTQEQVFEYFEYVAENTDIAIIAYNTYHSGISMTPETIARLAKIPAVCTLKDAVNDVAHTVRAMELCGDQIVISDPLEDHFLLMATQFGQQIMLGTTSVFLMQSPEYQPIQEYYDLAKAGKMKEATIKFYELQPLRDIWNSIYSVLWDKKAATHPLSTIKYWMDLMGMAGGPLRPPMPQLGDKEKAAFKERLEATGWMKKLFPKGSPQVR
jgi:4-hydroxy-tetrahydrodipicolinate synthase